MLRGTRIIRGKEAELTQIALDIFSNELTRSCKFERVILPSIWESKTFKDKVGPENQEMMWTFQDKGQRDVCLIPEVTGIIQEMWQQKWSKEQNTLNLFYDQRCYRYERPQKGRYREFRQFGVECLGRNDEDTMEWLACLSLGLIEKFTLNVFKSNLKIDLVEGVSRGMSYYTGPGFEVNIESLGAQKQVVGGGSYEGGCGFAIGIDRLVLAVMEL